MQLKKNSFLSYLLLIWRRLLWFVGFRPYLYTSIDELPIYNWWQVHETGDINYLMIDNKFGNTPQVIDYCTDLWDDLKQQQLDYVGVSQEYSRYLKLVADLALAKLQYAISNDNWDLFKLELVQSELDELKAIPQEDSAETKAIIEKHWLNGQRLDPKKTTVKEYYSYIKSLQNLSTHGKSN